MPKNPTKQKSNILGFLRAEKGDQNEDHADWTKADPKMLSWAVGAVTTAGGAIRFGYTRDGSAYSIGIYLGDDRETVYARPYDDIDSILRQIAEGMENAPKG